MRGITYLVPVKSIHRFERQNPNILINVFGYGDKKCFQFAAQKKESDNII